MVSIDVHVRGPVFNGAAQRAVDDYVAETEREIAQRGLAVVHHILDRSIRHPTPYYETQIMVERQRDSTAVHDRGIVYGPWLEGTGSRNRTTRFKGYHSFRRAAQQLRTQAGDIAERVLHRYLPRMR